MQEIRIIDADQQFTVTLNGQRYGMRVRYNEQWERWTFDILIDGEIVYGSYPLIEGEVMACNISCLPYSFGGLYLENVTASSDPRLALPRGEQRLWFMSRAEKYALYGSTVH